jgi:hypothetical protein
MVIKEIKNIQGRYQKEIMRMVLERSGILIQNYSLVHSKMAKRLRGKNLRSYTIRFTILMMKLRKMVFKYSIKSKGMRRKK